MAGIFNLFGDLPAPDRGQSVKLVARSKSSIEIGGHAGKSAGPSKPKGLSIRSNSDLNVPTTQRANLKQGVSNSKPIQFLKPKLTQLDDKGCPISPSKELAAKKQSVKKIRDPSPRPEASNRKPSKAEKLSDDVIFKKPLPPKRIVKKPVYPEPEFLAPCWNSQNEFENIYGMPWDYNFPSLKKTEIKLYDDEGFESDPEILPSPKTPALSVPSAHSEQEWQKGWSPELPNISDDEF